MRIAITGATGFIGSKLSDALAARGDEVVAFTRNPAKAQDRLPDGTLAVAWDPLQSPAPGKAFEGVDAVVNLAGEPLFEGRWTVEQKKAIYDSRIIGTANLVDGMEDLSSRPRVLVSGSGINYYGSRGDQILDENSPPGSDFLAQVCVDWEAEARRAEKLGMRVVTLRTAPVLGEGGGVLGPMLRPFRLGLGGPMGSGRQWMSWIHTDDGVGLILHAIDRQEVAGPMNASSPEPVRNAEFAKTLGRVLGKPAVLPLPGLALRLLVGEAAVVILGSERVMPDKALATGYRFRYPMLDEALRDVLCAPEGAPAGST